MEWKSINESPEKSGYVIVAYTHFGIPMVGEGFCKLHEDGRATFKENTYMGQGVAITHWMPMPDHPCGKNERKEDAEQKTLTNVECRSTQRLNKNTKRFLPK